MNKRLIFAVVLMVALFAAVAWLDTNGYHYPCVRCFPIGHIWTP
jgi:hypothetical protein